METVGVLAHRGGFLVHRPEVTIGVVRAVSRLDGLEIEVISRVPRDRLGPSGPASPHRLPPVHDKRVDLRLGWLDGDGRVRWEHFSSGSSTAHFRTPYRRFQGIFALPPLFDRVSLVLAWPEVHFPETVITLPLPDRETVERSDSTAWRAGGGTAVTDEWDRRPATPVLDPVEVESGTVVAGPVVLHGAERAAVVLTRATAVGPLLSLEVLSIARGEVETAVAAFAFSPTTFDDPVLHHQGSAAVAVVHGLVAHSLESIGGSATGGGAGYTAQAEYLLPRPAGDTLDLLVSWPLAGLAEVRVRVDLD
jgi:hypothetical protein